MLCFIDSNTESLFRRYLARGPDRMISVAIFKFVTSLTGRASPVTRIASRTLGFLKWRARKPGPNHVLITIHKNFLILPFLSTYFFLSRAKELIVGGHRMRNLIVILNVFTCPSSDRRSGALRQNSVPC